MSSAAQAYRRQNSSNGTPALRLTYPTSRALRRIAMRENFDTTSKVITDC